MLHRRLILGLLASIACLLVGQTATAQGLFTTVNRADRSAPDYERFQELQYGGTLLKGQLNISSIGNRTPSGAQQEFDRYFNMYLERMTLETTLADLPKLRQSISGDLAALRSARNIHDQAVQSLLTNLEKLARDEALDGVLPVTIGQIRANTPSATDGKFPVDTPYHRATRTNAMLMIGELNSEEPAGLTDEGKPLPAALDVLVRAWSDDQLPIEVRVAALTGISRHAHSGITDNNAKGNVRAAMLALLNESEAPDGRSAAAQVWLRQSAAEILGNLKDLGNGGETLKALVAIVEDKQAPLKLRCSAAEALAPLAYDGTVQLRRVGQALGTLAVDAAILETNNRSYLRHYLACISQGIGTADAGEGRPTAISIAAAASSDEDKQYMAALAEHVNDLQDVVEKAEPDDDEDDISKISVSRKPLILQKAGEIQTFLRENTPANEQIMSGE